MGKFFAFVASDRCWVNAEFLELMVQQNSRTGAGLAVDEADAALGHISETVNRFWIAARNENALLPLRQVN